MRDGGELGLTVCVSLACRAEDECNNLRVSVQACREGMHSGQGVKQLGPK